MNKMDDETKLLFVDTFSKLMIAAFSMVAALAWNEAIKTLIEEWIGKENHTMGLFIYAIIVTIIAILAIIMITRSFNRLNRKVSAEKKE